MGATGVVSQMATGPASASASDSASLGLSSAGSFPPKSPVLPIPIGAAAAPKPPGPAIGSPGDVATHLVAAGLVLLGRETLGEQRFAQLLAAPKTHKPAARIEAATEQPFHRLPVPAPSVSGNAREAFLHWCGPDEGCRLPQDIVSKFHGQCLHQFDAPERYERWLHRGPRNKTLRWSILVVHHTVAIAVLSSINLRRAGREVLPHQGTAIFARTAFSSRTAGTQLPRVGIWAMVVSDFDETLGPRALENVASELRDNAVMPIYACRSHAHLETLLTHLALEVEPPIPISVLEGAD